MFNLYICIVVITIFFCIITSFDVIDNRLISKEIKKNTILISCVISMVAICECVGVITNGASVNLIGVHRYSKLIEFSMSPVLAYLFGSIYGKMRYIRLMNVLVKLHCLIEICAFKFGAIFSVDDQNIYHREWKYFIYIAFYFVISMYSFYCIWCERKDYNNECDTVLILTLLFFIGAVIVQMIRPELRIIFLTVSMCNFLFYNRKCKLVLQNDILTGLLNRRVYENAIFNFKERAVIIVFDINRFKEINDRYGHLEGDKYIKRVAQLIYEVYGKYGECYRIGGDEFCVIMRKDLERVDELQQELRDTIENIKQTDERMPDVAIGSSYYTYGVSDIRSVLEDADKRMYENKAQLKL